MFNPKYHLNTSLLSNIVRIKNLIAELNNQRFPELVLARFEKDSYAISAYASTSIEGNPIPLTDVRKILKHTPAHVRDTEKEILNYNRALEQLSLTIANPEPVTEKFVRNTQAIVTNELIAKKDHGLIRKEPVVVNDPIKRVIAYIPPDAKDVNTLMNELIDYMDGGYGNIDPLIMAGIFHKQFVIIHPFMDGNGRTARLVTKYLLARMGLDTFQLFSFENYYNQNVTRYFSSVGMYGDYYEIAENVDFTDWLVYFTDGIIDELLRVQKQLQNSVMPMRIADHEKVVIEHIKKHGSISKSQYDAITDRARSTQILDLKKLVDKGILQKNGVGKSTYYTLAGQ